MKHTNKSIIAALIGNMLEWYDFAVFGFLAVIIGAKFFPSSSQAISTISALGAFAGAYAARPFGGIIFGFIGDRFGRKTMLRLSILLMGIPTVLIGLLPSYIEIGITAPIILTLLRFLQGISIGGEYIGSMVYLSEIAPKEKKYFYSSFAIAGILGGILFGSLVCSSLLWIFGEQGMFEFWWRIPFLLGVVIIIFGIWMRKNIDDTHLHIDRTHNPIIEALSRHKKALLLSILLTAYIGIGFHTLFIWFPTYMSTIVEPHIKDALRYTFISLLFYLAAIFIGAKTADKYGARTIFVYSLSIFILFLYPAFWLVNKGDLVLAICTQSFLAVILAISHALSPMIISRLFPTQIRVSGLGLGFNIMVALFAGTAPLVSTYLIKITSDKLFPAYYIALFSIIAIFAFLWMEKDKQYGKNL